MQINYEERYIRITYTEFEQMKFKLYRLFPVLNTGGNHLQIKSIKHKKLTIYTYTDSHFLTIKIKSLKSGKTYFIELRVGENDHFLYEATLYDENLKYIYSNSFNSKGMAGAQKLDTTLEKFNKELANLE